MSDLARRMQQLSPEQRALLEARLKAQAQPGRGREPIAIVGIGCRLPGGADGPDAFMRMLDDGVDAVRQIPDDRWSRAELYDPDPDAPGKVSSTFGGFVDGVDRFDAAFFAISPREASRMDPQQRLLLEVAAEAFDDAGLPRESLAGTPTGVFVGAHSHAIDYLLMQYADPAAIDAFTGTGTAHNLLAGRLSYTFDLRGPAVAVDTACSSSLVAVHLAVQSLRAGECSVALAAGVNLILSPHFTIAASRMHMLAPDGRCKAFDRRADGFVRGEGCGAVVLKRLTDAVAAGDVVHAVIRGSATNQDGRTNGVTAPSGLAQQRVIERALEDAGVAGASVGYVEAHGTGTSLGDPIEVEALAATVGRASPGSGECVVGAVKTNIGHLEGAAGVAGLIKAAMVVRDGRIPRNLHFTGLNPHIDVRGTRLAFATEPRAWSARTRVAGVSSFGWSGTNAHVVLESPPEPPRIEDDAPRGALVLPVSARSPAALSALASAYRDALRGADPARALELCRAAARRRSHDGLRLAVAGSAAKDLVDALDRAIAARPGSAPRTAPRVAFVFPGQGAQWVGMGRSLLRDEPVFAESVERLDAAIREEAPWSLVDVLRADAPSAAIDVVQPTLFAVGVALADLWRSWGVVPDAVVGHSMGEVAAAHVAGALTLRDAVRVIVRRSRLLLRIAGRGAMALVELPEAEARAACEAHGDMLSVAVVNGPRSTVVAGDPGALDAMLGTLRARGVFCRPVKVDVASHSAQVDPLRADLLAALADVRPRPPGIQVYSTVTGGAAAPDAFGAAYWIDNLRRPVRFLDAAVAMLRDGIDAYVESSPHPVLLPAIDDAIAEVGADAIAVASTRRDESERLAMLEGLATLYGRGARIDWAHVLPGPVRTVALPGYPWQRDRHWLEASPARAPMRGPAPGVAVPRVAADTRGWLYAPAWREAPAPSDVPPGPTRWLVHSDASDRVDALVARLRATGRRVVHAVASDRFEALDGDRWRIRPDVPEDHDRVLAALLDAGSGPACVVHVQGADAPDDAAPAGSQARGGAVATVRVAHAVQALLRRDASDSPRFTLVTEGAQAADAASVSVAQAALWGVARVLAEEHPELRARMIDVEPGLPADAMADRLALEAAVVDGEDAVRLRARGVREVLRLLPAGAGAGPPLACRPDGTYLVTGGLGGVGLATARWLIDRGARHIVLAGRRGLPPRETWGTAEADADRDRIDAVRALEAFGASVVAVSLDVADADAVERFVASRAREARPPLRGVVHAAAVTGDVLLRDLGRDTVDAVFRPKLAGAEVLARIALRDRHDFLVLYSSLGAVLGPPGQAAYAAANAGVDALAVALRARGLRCVAVNWAAWTELGLAQSAGARRTIEELERRGIRGFMPDEGLDALGHAVDGDATCVAVMPADWKRYAEVASRTRIPSIVADLARAPSDDVAADASPVAGLAALDPDARVETVSGLLREALASVLRLPLDRIEPDRPMGALGLESLTALELRKRLEMLLGLRLSATVMWNYPTPAALAAHLADRLAPGAPAGQRTPAPDAGPADATDPAPIGDDVSDADALRALGAGKGRRR